MSLENQSKEALNKTFPKKEVKNQKRIKLKTLLAKTILTHQINCKFPTSKSSLEKVFTSMIHLETFMRKL